jgi:hypothetical protein
LLLGIRTAQFAKSDESDGTRKMLNRSAVTIKAKQPFIDWVLALPESEHVTRNDIDEDSTVYLLPDSFDDTTNDKLLQQFYQRIFEEQLSDWHTDEESWPKKRDVALFKKWFELEFHTVILDLVGDSLEDDD